MIYFNNYNKPKALGIKLRLHEYLHIFQLQNPGTALIFFLTCSTVNSPKDGAASSPSFFHTAQSLRVLSPLTQCGPPFPYCNREGMGQTETEVGRDVTEWTDGGRGTLRASWAFATSYFLCWGLKERSTG